MYVLISNTVGKISYIQYSQIARTKQKFEVKKIKIGVNEIHKIFCILIERIQNGKIFFVSSRFY